MGFAEQGAFGQQPISWAEALAYGQATAELEQPWEFKALIRMSRAYCEGLRLGEKPFAKTPGAEDDDGL